MCSVNSNHITTELVSKLCISSSLGKRQYAIIPVAHQVIQKYILCVEMLMLWAMQIVSSGSQFIVAWLKPIWAPFNIMQMNICTDLHFKKQTKTFLSVYRAFLSFRRVKWKVSLLLRIKAEEKPGPRLIHVTHTSGMLCMDNWLLKQHAHRWILMVLPKCHLTDVTVAPILKRLVSKASIRAHFSPTVSGETALFVGFLFQRDRSCICNLICAGQCTHFQRGIEHFQS